MQNLLLVSTNPIGLDLTNGEYDTLTEACNGYRHISIFTKGGKAVQSASVGPCPCRGKCGATVDTGGLIPKSLHAQHQPTAEEVAFRERLNAVFAKNRAGGGGNLFAELMGSLSRKP